VDAIVRERWGRALLLVPTRTAAGRRLESLVFDGNLQGSWNNPVTTLEDLSLRVLQAQGFRVHRINELERRMLVEGVVRRLATEGKLEVLGEAATSDGFVNHVLRVITQLKQAAIDPAQFRDVIARRTHQSWLDPIVAAVYQGYQDSLQRTRAYDRVGIYWQTELVIMQSRPSVLDDVDTLAFDSFEDFTASEFRLIKALAAHVSDLFIGIDGDLLDPSQQDLYAIPRNTQKKILEELEGVREEDFPGPAPATHSEYIAREMFWRQKPLPPIDLRPNVTFGVCPDLRQEIEYVGRAIKTLNLEAGVPCDRIAVVFRDVREAGPVLRAVFEEFGIPANVESSLLLEETSLARFVLTLFDACDTWSRHDVLDTIGSPWFATDELPAEQVSQFAVLARRAGIVEGQHEWSDRIRQLIVRMRDKPDWDDIRSLNRLPGVHATIQTLLDRLNGLSDIAKLFPASARATAYVESIGKALERCGAKRALAGRISDAIRDREEAAWRALMMVLGRIDAWYRREDAGVVMEREVFFRVLRHAVRDTELELPKGTGGVVCKSADSIRYETYDHVFLCGMNEGEFPRPPAAGAIYSDADLADFAEHKIELDDKHRHVAREMLLFHHVVRSATVHLTLTYHTQSREGRAASPSPFWVDALELLQPIGIQPEVPGAPLFAPALEFAASMRDVRNRVFSSGTASCEASVEAFQHATEALEIEASRQDASAFGEYDGVLTNAAIVDAIAGHFGPDHDFSVNQLESYAGCPFRFFMTRILGVEPEEEPGLEFDPLVRGSILHDVLQAFHKEYLGKSISEIPESEAIETMTRHLDDVFARRVFQSSNIPPKVALVERMRMAVLLRRYLTIEREREDELWAPSHFEVSFGSGNSTDALSQSDPYALTTKTGPIRFTGRIDRVDTLGERARIIDYKSSVYAKATDIDEGVSIQLPLYALALEEHLMPGACCADALFIQVGGKTRLSGLEVKKVPWEERKERLREQIAEHVARIRRAEFPPRPYHVICRECRDHRACRYESARIERKMEARQ
jgi:ATP-dependent helicase/DNAse subunit B